MISTRGRYALRVMLDLAENENGKYIPLKDIAARQEISKKYLEIIVKDLVAAGMVVGASGLTPIMNVPAQTFARRSLYGRNTAVSYTIFSMARN